MCESVQPLCSPRRLSGSWSAAEELDGVATEEDRTGEVAEGEDSADDEHHGGDGVVSTEGQGVHDDDGDGDSDECEDGGTSGGEDSGEGVVSAAGGGCVRHDVLLGDRG